jgi:putative redox protein
VHGQSIKVAFEGAHGRLAGVIEAPEGEARASAIFAHCFSCSKDVRAAREITRALQEAGIAALRFDFAGLGASEGQFSQTTFTSNIEDLREASAFLARDHAPPSLLIGHSLGGAAALVAAAQMPSIKAVATIGAPAETAHVAHQFADSVEAIALQGEAQVSLAGRPFTITRAFLDDLDTDRVVAAAAALRRPLLVMHAPLDQTVGIENAARIFGAARHPKSFISLDGADHLLSRAADARYAGAMIAAWSSRYI